MKTTSARSNSAASSPMESSSRTPSVVWRGCQSGPARERNAGALRAFPRQRRIAPACAAQNQQQPRAIRAAMNAAMHRIVLIWIGRLLRRHGAGGDPDGLWPASASRNAAMSGAIPGAGGVKSYFRFPALATDSVGRARDDEAAGVLLGLGQNRIGPTQDVAEKAAGGAVARQRAIGDAAVDDQQRRSGALRFAIQIGPDLGFEHHHQRRGRRRRSTRRTTER